jgi:beta-galactosidase
MEWWKNNQSQTVKVENKLSKLLPGTNLASNLDRGATPKTPSYFIKRNPVSIVNVTSPSNANNAYKNYDDNE